MQMRSRLQMRNAAAVAVARRQLAALRVPQQQQQQPLKREKHLTLQQISLLLHLRMALELV
jgi:hypothetical protein